MNFLASNLTSSQQQQGQTTAEKQLRPLLFDEAVHVLSTFELNQMASLTYNDVTCDDMFELIRKICSKPLEHTPLSIQKALVVTKHVVLYGQEKTVNHAYGLQDYFKALSTFNTVLMTQKQGGALAFFQTIQGGGVDKGGPVRQAAQDMMKLLSNINELRRMRNACASQESLVPVGDDKVAFVTDEVRHHILTQRIERERQIQIKSNLAKADNGFGAGYSASDGKSVVGAAHGIEEMIKMAKIQKRSFSDDDPKPPGYKTEEERILEELQAELEASKKAASKPAVVAPEADLLGLNYTPTTPAQEVDLLGFGDTITTTTAAPSPYQPQVADLLGGIGGPGVSFPQPTTMSNVFAPGLATTTISSATTINNNNLVTGGLTRTPAPMVDPFASLGGPMTANPPFPMSSQSTMSDMNLLASGVATMGLGVIPSAPSHLGSSAVLSSSTSSSLDRFAALDVLAQTNPMPSTVPVTTAVTAETTNGIGLTSTKSAYPPDLNSLVYATTPNPTYSYASTSGIVTASNAYNMPIGMSPAPPPPSLQPLQPPPVLALGSGRVATSYGEVGQDVEEDNPWVMGGTAGSGLEPVGPAPGSAPPPPPPSW
jgi:ENTH domain